MFPRRGRRGRFGPGFANPHLGGRAATGRGARRTRADIRAAVLVLVADEPVHGYQIIQEITARSDGAWTPSPGSVYPTLSQLVDEGLVRTEQADGRSVAHLTEDGRRYVDDHRAELDRVWSTAGAPVDTDIADLRAAASELVGTAAQVAQVGRPDQVAAAINQLNDARRRLYLLLADSPGSEDTDRDG